MDVALPFVDERLVPRPAHKTRASIAAVRTPELFAASGPVASAMAEAKFEVRDGQIEMFAAVDIVL